MPLFLLTCQTAVQWEMGDDMGIVEYSATSYQRVIKTQDIAVWSQDLNRGSPFAG